MKAPTDSLALAVPVGGDTRTTCLDSISQTIQNNISSRHRPDILGIPALENDIFRPCSVQTKILDRYFINWASASGRNGLLDKYIFLVEVGVKWAIQQTI
jgi:hypothetical protein